MTPPTALSARRGGLALGTSWKNSTRGGGRFASISPPHIRAHATRRPRKRHALPRRQVELVMLENRRFVAQADLGLVLPLNFIARTNRANEYRGFVAEPYFGFVLALHLVARANSANEYRGFVAEPYFALTGSRPITNHLIAELNCSHCCLLLSPVASLDCDSQRRSQQRVRKR